MFKSIITLSALALSSTALAGGHGLALESVLVTADTIRIEYASKIRGCSLLLDDAGQRLTGKFICAQGAPVVLEADIDAIDVVPGDNVQLCALRDITKCSDLITVRESGDVNGDGEINVGDLMVVYNAIMGYDVGDWPAEDVDELAADMNNDGELNVIDILMLIEAMELDG